MVKQKQRHAKAVPENNSNTECIDEESWIIVKQQKVTILIPPVPSATKSTIPNLGPSPLQAMPININTQSQHSNEAGPTKPLADEREKSTSLAPNRGIKTARRTPHQYTPSIARPAIIDSRMESENAIRVPTSRPYNIHGLSGTSRSIKRPRFLHGISGSLDRSVLLKQRLRALNLERKLQKAGGLSRWLTSLGLGQFVRLFQGKGVNKFQLVNLTMKKLKDMGADAVGPRRKLMHAIECVCQPYCFEPL
ncbi:Sterile alpha motif domain-containing protein [Melia azedarach]|uniref:Sterile alpha motif domain-containing protein n=1 Tax=Melia azedarach TaxID=155640 RepID=A0ACC1X331_MELAZ|nr:Sterile alpha motif domain-containing protein [Melia azedarach]